MKTGYVDALLIGGPADGRREVIWGSHRVHRVAERPRLTSVPIPMDAPATAQSVKIFDYYPVASVGGIVLYAIDGMSSHEAIGSLLDRYPKPLK